MIIMICILYMTALGSLVFQQGTAPLSLGSSKLCRSKTLRSASPSSSCWLKSQS